ncbi:MAG: SDR family NAD(P)-dependent oxidoreductase [Dehalococcoidia bacterium]|nr:SDR family NAD(P)-dependent oxidoreductase [Dehalococcoidia bacterium]
MRVLITGGAGFIGSHLADALVARGDHVVIIDDLSTGSRANIAHLLADGQARLVEETILNAVVVDALTADVDLVVHLAAVVGVRLILEQTTRVIETNILGTHHVLQAAARHRRRVVIASTSEVYGKSGATPFTEDGDCVYGPTTKARWSYAVTKAADEFLALAYARERGLPVVIVRLFNTVGPRQTGQYGMVVPRFVQQALRGDRLTVYGDGAQSRCFLDVADAVRALLALIATPDADGRVFNLGGAFETTIIALAHRVLRHVGVAEEQIPHRLRFIPYEEALGPEFEDMQRRVPDTTRIRALTGWRPTLTLDETIQRVIAFERQRLAPPSP